MFGFKYKKYIAAIDIGNSKIAGCMIKVTEKKPMVIASVVEQYDQNHSYYIENLNQLKFTIKKLIHKLEKKTQRIITKAVINISIDDIISKISASSIYVDNNNIKQKDIDKIIKQAKMDRKNNYVVVHSLQQFFKVDQLQSIKDPIGMVGDKLSVFYHNIFISKDVVKNMIALFSSIKIQISSIVIGHISSGLSILTETEKQSGVMLIEIGAKYTNYTVYNKGANMYVNTIAQGGFDITRHIAECFDIKMLESENIKKKYANLYSNAKQIEEVIKLKQHRSEEVLEVTKQEVNDKIYEKLEQIFKKIRDDLCSKKIYSELGSNIILSGGSSKIFGIDQVAAKVFDRNTKCIERLLCNNKDAKDHGVFAANALGAALYGYNNNRDHNIFKRKSGIKFF